jgi:hypothetical protein
MDFVHDQLATGRKIRVLTVVDTFSRFSPAVDPRFSYRGEDVVGHTGAGLPLSRLSEDDPGRPGIGVISRDLDLWADQRGVELDFSQPGKPTDNAIGGDHAVLEARDDPNTITDQYLDRTRDGWKVDMRPCASAVSPYRQAETGTPRSSRPSQPGRQSPPGPACRMAAICRARTGTGQPEMAPLLWWVVATTFAVKYC